jgi:hypothetical protein
MPPKKKKGEGKKKKKKAEAPPPDPAKVDSLELCACMGAVLRSRMTVCTCSTRFRGLMAAQIKAEKAALDSANKERSACIAGVAWVAVARTWVQQERSRIFDQFRTCDADSELDMDMHKASRSHVRTHNLSR